MNKTRIVDTVERDGRKIAVYDNGMEKDAVTGRIVKAPPHAKITKENAHALQRKRQEKAARLLREAIVTETMDKLDVPRHGSAAAVAAAGGILWREIVLDANSYPRDRLDAWEKLGKYADVLQSAKDPGDSVPVAGAAEAITALSDLVTTIKAMLQPEVIDGKVEDG